MQDAAANLPMPSHPRDSSQDVKNSTGNDGEFEVLLVKDDRETYCYAVFCPALPGCVSDGRNQEEALAMIQDAIRLYLSHGNSRQTIHPDTAMAALTSQYSAMGLPIETTTVRI
jgi:predicted RNase H-like HicB family nuclease